jgi:hypothetical protein
MFSVRKLLLAWKGACPVARSLWKVGYKYHGRCWSKGSRYRYRLCFVIRQIEVRRLIAGSTV